MWPKIIIHWHAALRTIWRRFLKKDSKLTSKEVLCPLLWNGTSSQSSSISSFCPSKSPNYHIPKFCSTYQQFWPSTHPQGLSLNPWTLPLTLSYLVKMANFHWAKFSTSVFNVHIIGKIIINLTFLNGVALFPLKKA